MDVNNPLTKFIRWVLRRPAVVLVFAGVIFILSVWLLKDLKIDNSVDVFFNKQGTQFINFENWKEQFGTDQVVIAALETDDIFTPENLRLIDHLTRRFELLRHVDKVTSLTTVNTIIGQGEDLIIERLIEEVPDDPETLAALKDKAVRDPLYVKNVIAPDGRVAAILIELERPSGRDDQDKKIVMEAIQDVLRSEVPPHVRYHISGLTAIEYFYAAYMQKDFQAFMPFLLLMIIAVMYASFRSFKLVAVPMMAILISTACAMAFLYLLGYSVNNVTTIIPPILMAIMIADSVHVIGEGLARRRVEGKDGFLEHTMRHLFFPCFLTTATTGIGFWSLTLSTIPPVRQLGIVVGFGVILAFILTFTFVPALAKVWGVFEPLRRNRNKACASAPEAASDRSARVQADEGFARVLKGIAVLNARYYKWIVLAGVAIACISIAGAFKVRSETSVIEYFKPSTPIYQATVFVEERLSGVHTLNVSLRSSEPNYFYAPEALADIDAITAFLYSIPEVDKVMSVNDHLKQINQSFHQEDEQFYRLPDSRRMTAQYVLLYGREDLEDFMDDQWQWATVRIRLKEHSTVKLEGVIETIERYVQAYARPSLTVQVVGQTALEVESNNAVAEGQIKSLGLAMAVIFGMMFFVFRSVPIGLISMIPNMLPILMNFGLMGFLGIRLDSATSMIAAIGIGIVVDDTIHFLHGFSEAMKRTQSHSEAVEMTLQERGRPIIITSLILCAGFGILSVSSFLPTAYFGFLSAVLMLNALIADLFILPSVLIWLKPPFQGERDDGH